VSEKERFHRRVDYQDEQVTSKGRRSGSSSSSQHDNDVQEIVIDIGKSENFQRGQYATSSWSEQ
jgi:hypothetical protein